MRAAAPDYWKLFRPQACAVGLCGSTKDEILTEAVGLLAKSKQLSADHSATALRAIFGRERVASTGVGLGVAIPHVQLKGIEQVALNLCVTASGVEWQALDGAVVRVVFTVVRPDKSGPRHDPERHLELMRWISRVGRDADFRRFACTVESKSDLLELVRETAERLGT
jgi:mannitol/fructose-specific phosphotransferase system IIA component (Ntr-type)